MKDRCACGSPKWFLAAQCRECTRKRLAVERPASAPTEPPPAGSLYERRKAAGRCPHCGGERDTMFFGCSPCRARNARYKRRFDLRRKAAR